MAISNDFSHDVILGRDCPKLYDLMTNAITEIPQEILAVQTRQQSTVEHQSQQANEEAQQISDSQTRPFQIIGNDFDFPQSNLSLQAQQTDMAEEDEPPLEADDNVISLMNDQKADPTLPTLWKATELEDTEYVVHNQVLHRQTTDQMGEQRFQIVLPSNRCDEVIKLTHTPHQWQDMSAQYEPNKDHEEFLLARYVL